MFFVLGMAYNMHESMKILLKYMVHLHLCYMVALLVQGEIKITLAHGKITLMPGEIALPVRQD